MKVLTFIVFVFLFAGGSGFIIKVPTSSILPSQGTLGAKDWVHKQKLILQLFDNVCETSTDPIITRLAQEFTLDSENYTDPNVITDLKNLQQGHLLPRGEIFTEYDTNNWNEVDAIYAVLYYAKDFETFYKAAAWARQNVNCGLFVDAIYIAILNRRDTSKLSMPAPYELLPNYFIRKDIIVKASSLLAGEDFAEMESVKDEGNAYILDANYTGDISDNDEDSKLAYFREDIGLNSYYFLTRLKLVPLLDEAFKKEASIYSDINNEYGEYLYHIMKQLTARYDLERYANGLPELECLKWDSPIQAYDPMLVYSNGYEFSHRMFDVDLTYSHGIDTIQNIENNIVTIVSDMRQTGYNKTQVINHLMGIFIKSYITLTSKLLTSDTGLTNGQFSVLHHLMTSLRDPIFWKLNKRYVELVDNGLKMMPKYTRNELYFPGVEIINVETKKMMTQFENFQIDVTDSLKSNDRDTSFQVKISQPRLNHKPFVIKLNISSLTTGQRGLVKIYLGPKMLPGELASKKNSFVLLDLFEINLKRGTNIISRSSNEMKSISNDFESLRALRKRVEDAEFGFDVLSPNTIDSQINYPSRLILPKGSPEGLSLEMFVFVAPFSKTSFDGTLSFLNTEFNDAALSPGYPLDLSIDDHQLFNIPNAFTKEIVVTQKGDNKNYEGGGKDQKWTPGKSFNKSSRPDYSAKRGGYNKDEEKEEEVEDVDIMPITNSRLLGLRPDFTKRKEPVDDSSKRGQYGKKYEYATRKGTIDNKDEEREEDVDVMPITNSRLLGLRPDFTKRKEPVDNSSKRGQYGKKYEYATRKGTIDNNSNIADTDTIINEDQKSLRPESTYKKREPYDYATKKEKYENRNYMKKYEKYVKKNLTQDDDIVTNISINDLAKVGLEKDTVENDNNLVEKYKLISDEVDDPLNGINDHVRKIDNGPLRIDSIEESPKKRWTFLDYFISSLYDSSEEKVYE